MVPAALPSIDVTLGGRRLPERAALVALRVDQRLSSPSQCEIVLEPSDDAGVALGALGDSIEIRAAGALLFLGEVCAREITHARGAAPRVSLRGYDALIQLARSQRVRAHVGVSPADLLEELSNDAGLRIAADERGPVHAHVIQNKPNDLALCADICQRAGLYFFVVPGGDAELFSLRRMKPSWSPARSDDVLRLEVSHSSSVAPKVNVLAWHPRSNEIHAADAAGDASARGQRVLTSYPADDDAQAEAAARAHADHQGAAGASLRALVSGDAALRPGVRAVFPKHAGARPDGYLLCRAVHRVSAESGYITEISSEPPPRSPSLSGPTLVLGVVTAVEPARLAVKARLPAFADVETDWMKVASAGGGAATGLLTLPHVGDVVLVACAHDDPSRGVVLGGLVPDAGPGVPLTNDEMAFQLRSRAGAALELSDAASRVRLEDARGSKIVLDEAGVELFARGDIHIRAPGKTVTISAARIDFKRAEGEP